MEIMPTRGTTAMACTHNLGSKRVCGALPLPGVMLSSIALIEDRIGRRKADGPGSIVFGAALLFFRSN